jgi:thioredoxin-like negative regulator of GroEL
MPSFQILDQFNFHHTLEATPGLAIAFFTREGCGSCRHWRRVLADYVARHPHAAHIFEVDAERDSALTREFGVFHLPALFLFHNGHFHAELKVEAHPDKLQQAIDAALSVASEEIP